MRIVKAGLACFATVFGAGFVFGSIRVPLLVPRLGVRTAELLEMPLMLVVIVLSARWTVRCFDLPPAAGVRLGTGLLALALLVGTELALSVLIAGRPLADYLAGRDPVSGSVYLALLVLFAAMPLVLARLR